MKRRTEKTAWRQPFPRTAWTIRHTAIAGLLGAVVIALVVAVSSSYRPHFSEEERLSKLFERFDAIQQAPGTAREILRPSGSPGSSLAALAEQTKDSLIYISSQPPPSAGFEVLGLDDPLVSFGMYQNNIPTDPALQILRVNFAPEAGKVSSVRPPRLRLRGAFLGEFRISALDFVPERVTQHARVVYPCFTNETTLSGSLYPALTFSGEVDPSFRRVALTNVSGSHNLILQEEFYPHPDIQVSLRGPLGHKLDGQLNIELEGMFDGSEEARVFSAPVSIAFPRFFPLPNKRPLILALGVGCAVRQTVYPTEALVLSDIGATAWNAPFSFTRVFLADTARDTHTFAIYPGDTMLIEDEREFAYLSSIVQTTGVGMRLLQARGLQRRGNFRQPSEEEAATQEVARSVQSADELFRVVAGEDYSLSSRGLQRILDPEDQATSSLVLRFNRDSLSLGTEPAMLLEVSSPRGDASIVSEDEEVAFGRSLRWLQSESPPPLIVSSGDERFRVRVFGVRDDAVLVGLFPTSRVQMVNLLNAIGGPP